MDQLPTLTDLLARIPGSWSHVAKTCHLSQRALYDLRMGFVPPARMRRATLHALSQAVGATPDEVIAAIERQLAKATSSASPSDL
jgi:hypothetical protein